MEQNIDRPRNGLSIFKNCIILSYYIMQLIYCFTSLVISDIPSSDTSCSNGIQFVPCVIIVSSLHSFFMYSCRDNLTKRYEIINKLTNLLFFCFYISYTIYVTINQCQDFNYIFIFLWIYVSIEYIMLPLLKYITIMIIVCFGVCIFFLSVSTHIPDVIGLSKIILDKLSVYKFENDLLIPLNVKISGERIKIETNDASCIICLDDYKNDDKIRVILCKHHFHKECSDKWFKLRTTCPVCRTDMVNLYNNNVMHV